MTRNIALSLIVAFAIGVAATIGGFFAFRGPIRNALGWTNGVYPITNTIYVQKPDVIKPETSSNSNQTCISTLDWIKIYTAYYGYTTSGIDVVISNNVLDVTHYTTRIKYKLPNYQEPQQITVGAGLPLNIMVNYISPIRWGGYIIGQTNQVMFGVTYTFKF